MKRSNERGVTLIETVVAVGLFALTAATMGSFLTFQVRAGGSNHNSGIAYSLAAEELEDLRAVAYDDIISRSSSFTSGSLTFELQTTVDDDTPAPNMKRITVAVNWAEPNGNKNVTVHTIYTEIRR
jgi:type II secretory pathway pseudopilin PulG